MTNEQLGAIIDFVIAILKNQRRRKRWQNSSAFAKGSEENDE
jgi:hypothetical protein